MIHPRHDNGGGEDARDGRDEQVAVQLCRSGGADPAETPIAQDPDLEALYTDFGRPSIPPERLIRASLLQILFSVRSERQLMEQMDYNLMFRWFVGLGIDDPVWGEGRPGIGPVDQFSPERAKPQAGGPRYSPGTATGC